jgi:hypothetical protein
MFQLFRLLMTLATLAAFLWFATSVPLGKRTLWGHLHAIFATQAAKDLAEGTKEEAERVARRVRDELERDAGTEDARPESTHEHKDHASRKRAHSP